ncbi:FKBP-type peptidyl-prolyl cis-trans isomerase [Wenyingzhuangia sp. 2_MG-2023]|uniref:FKBP-type peptidyl-prolyl cis-trans isomerase n=1 Tax=Wenyingzhuangia sp. 2_MG-2023 TaxID=3062639 RepID=UPI0026E369EA|nr:FKBP-type peptidyl-prolyl cis-trans isomerase [Wenyingzhuangia sp. 2_MG-2023]MDO6738322.1 FKBP-type peptidyl-prolyl cis-trans isomerase [Wenyingzhuangia sp. 2_MG-2023]MDO6802194.1 FKBP-type peptidyl-prolyl cis-trans isomerase [Wenyingzhuangia sp. 1_MG-2023]
MNIIKGLALGLVVTGMVSCNQKVARKTALATEQDSVSYALGAYINLNFKVSDDFKDLNYEVFNQAMKEAQDSSKTLLSQKEIAPILIAYTKKKAEKVGESAKKEGEAFLAENKKKEGVTVTESGLQYEVITEGTGEKPTATQTVKVHYHGTTPEGEVFDSSVDRGTPAEFPLNRVIPGWTEGVQLMSVGSKYKFYVPQELAYGANAPQGGSGPIKAYMPLVFEVELLEIVK